MDALPEQASPQQLLFVAAYEGDVGKVRALVEAGVDINVRWGLYNQAALIRAVQSGSEECVRYLLEQGALVDKTDCENSTPLMYAASLGNVAILNLLLEAGADINAMNIKGETAEYSASRAKQKQNMEILKSRREAEQVVFTRMVQDRVLEEIYDMNEMERITLLRKEAGGPVEAMLREDFSSLPEGRLGKVFEAYHAKGGRKTEEEVFCNRIKKTKLSLKGMP